MKSIESSLNLGRRAALEILGSMAPDELARVFDLGLTLATFRRGIERTALIPERSSALPRCGQSTVPLGLSGLRPKLFLSNELSELEAAAVAAQGLFEMARAIYLGQVAGADVGDLDVWLDAGLPATVQLVPPRFIEAYGNDRTMLRIDTAGAPALLCSFTALRRLVLLDG